MSTQIQIRRDTTANWESVNPVLADGEIGFDTTKQRFKVGNGVTPWSGLDYTVGDGTGGGVSDWADIENKPTEFPPEAHTHEIEDVIGLQDALNNGSGPPVYVDEDAPENPAKGNLWFDTNSGELNLFDGSDWVVIGSGGGGDSKPDGYDDTKAIASGVMTTGEMVVLNDDGTVSVVGGSPTNLTDSNYIGVSKGDYADGSEATVQIAGINDDQQGMTVGKQYILPDGSLTTDEISGGGEYEFGTPKIFSSSPSEIISSTYNPVAKKIVIAYRDNGNSGYGTAIVGTVSGESITFGTPEVFSNSPTNHISAASDPVSNKVIISYADNGNSNYGTAIVGTVSGESITFGTPEVFSNSSTFSTSNTYDPVSNNVVISYRDFGNSNYGTAVVGIVSGSSAGSSIIFGTPVVFNNGSTSSISAASDPVANKVIISYQDSGNSGYGTSVVGTVSGDSISFGTPVVFNSETTSEISSTYDSTNNKVVSSYRGSAPSNYGIAIVGTVSGGSIAFGSPEVFSRVETSWISTVHDPVANKVFIYYSDQGDSWRGNAVVGTVSGESIAFGSPELFNGGGTYYISAASDPVANKIVISYISGNANYGTAVTYGIGAGKTNVFAGTAISSTELNIKDTV